MGSCRVEVNFVRGWSQWGGEESCPIWWRKKRWFYWQTVWTSEGSHWEMAATQLCMWLGEEGYCNHSRSPDFWVLGAVAAVDREVTEKDNILQMKLLNHLHLSNLPVTNTSESPPKKTSTPIVCQIHASTLFPDTPGTLMSTRWTFCLSRIVT